MTARGKPQSLLTFSQKKSVDKFTIQSCEILRRTNIETVHIKEREKCNVPSKYRKRFRHRLMGKGKSFQRTVLCNFQ